MICTNTLMAPNMIAVSPAIAGRVCAMSFLTFRTPLSEIETIPVGFGRENV